MAQTRRAHEDERGNASQRGYIWRWRRESKAFLRAHPLCECSECDQGKKRVRASQVVDHKIAHRGDQTLFWDQTNWQAMSKTCHDRKTAREDGGFGRGGAGQILPA